MSLVLTLEHGPRAQAVREARLETGELVIGRSPEADWQIEDPEMFISRAHCKISGGPDDYVVTDISSSGLYIDDSANPLGSGNSTRLRHGMRLRLGDYVLWVAVRADRGATPEQPSPVGHVSRPPVSLDKDDFFLVKSVEEPQRPRPAELPKSFEQPKPGQDQPFRERSSQAFDDPFSLDPVSSRRAPAESRPRTSIDPLGFGNLPVEPPRQPDPTPRPAFSADFAFGPSPARETVPERPARAVPQQPAAPWEIAPQRPAERTPGPDSIRVVAESGAYRGAPSDDLRAAFLRGLGVADDAASARDPIAEMEKFGREYRLMLDGLMQLLRKRAEEKGNARVAQTVIGSSEVNPLKFLPTVDDVLATLMAERSPGFLGAEAAIGDSVRDLAQHHVRAWRGVQGALRRMIDRFDPEAIEEELKSNSTLGTLLSGGRSAKLWELYRKRHREIAQSAETRFLGEIGADFRDAYEEE
ncbi:MAG: type VI secretion system-associated FHA domain protein TagH [Pseudomonadota bacterium]